MRRRIFVILCAADSVLVSCASQSKVTVQVQKPAAIHLSGVRKIAVVDFQGPDRSGSQIASMLQSALVNSQFYDIIERDKIQQVLAEQKLGMSGVVDDATAAEVGKLLGVDAMIFGEVTTCRVEPDERGSEKVEAQEGTGRYEMVDEKNIFTGKTKKVKKEIMKTVLVDKYYRIRRGTVAVNFRVVGIQDGRLLAARSDSKSYNSGKVYDQNSNTLPPEGQILSDLSNALSTEFVRMIAPFTIAESREIESGKGDIDTGKKYAQAGLWDEAIEAFRRATVVMPQESAGFYDLGVAYEVRGDLDLAEAAYKKAVGINPKPLYMNAIARIRKAREDNKRLQEQLDSKNNSAH
jgi:curli biogenesis system outer membrane secretion channel CsgG